MKLKKRLGDLLVELGYVSENDVLEAIKEQKLTGKRLGEIFVNKGLVSEEVVLKILEVQLGTPIIELENEDFDMDAVTSISESLAKKYELIPVKFNKSNLVVAMADPLNIFAEEDVSISTGYNLEIKLALKGSINAAISKYYSKNYMNEVADKLKKEEEEKLDELIIKEENDSPAIKLIDTIIENAVRNKASDIHIEPGRDKISIRYRVDGKLKRQFESPKEPFNAMITRIKLLGGMDIAERRRPQDGKIVRKIDGREIDLRVSIIPSIEGENIVIRILDKLAFELDKDSLGFTSEDKRKIENILNNPYGILLVTGPTGSGKTSSLYSILKDINRDENNVITIEDPVEYSLDKIVQINVNEKAGLTFSNGLKAMLRQDPDVIMVGEIRDEETAVMAIRAAITGHSVLSTLHTNDAPSAIVRLIDMGVKPYLIASSLVGVVAQRLIRRLCESCKEKYIATAHEKEILKIDKDIELYKPCGCAKCGHTGFKGRIGIFEVMEVTPKIRELIGENASLEKVTLEAQREGMTTLYKSARDKVLDGTTSISELLNVTLIRG